MCDVEIKLLADDHLHSFDLDLKKGFKQHEVDFAATAFDILDDEERVAVVGQVRTWLDQYGASARTELDRAAFKELLCFVKERVCVTFSEM
jgi:hypothetical protein